MDAKSASFRPLAPTDAALVAAMHRDCFAQAWNASVVRTQLGVRGTWGMLAYLEGDQGPDPIGYCMVRGVRDETEILSFGIVAAYRRCGFGRALLNVVSEQARHRGAGQMFLEVADDNEAGHALYAAAGFVAVGRRPNYYRRPPNGPVDAVVMRLDLATHTLTEQTK